MGSDGGTAMSSHHDQPAWLADVQAFAGWFGEKGTQLEPADLVAFGIPLSSRYGNVSEMIEMLLFAQLVATAGVAWAVASVFYDSKACLCTVELHACAERQLDVQAIIGECGDMALSCFVMDEEGTVRGSQSPPI